MNTGNVQLSDPTVKPTEEVLVRVLELLIADKISRSEVTTWASFWYLDDDFQPEATVREALYSLTGADAISVDRPYLFQEVDFREWLDRLVR